MFSPDTPLAAHLDLIRTAQGRRFGTILADPLWQFQNRTGKSLLRTRSGVAPEQCR